MFEIAINKMADQHIDDVTVLKRIAQGDEDALATLYARYGGKLYNYALRILGDPVVADDVLQESLLTIWQKAASFRGEGRVIAWMFGIVHNKAMRTFREKQHAPLPESMPAPTFLETEVDDKLMTEERQMLLRAGLAQLSVNHRTVLELVFYQGMTMKEIAHVCDIPVGTVKSRLSYARTILKGILSGGNVAMEDLT